jgi:hypothetical protein
MYLPSSGFKSAMASRPMPSIITTKATTITCLKVHESAGPLCISISTLKKGTLLPHKSPFFPPLVKKFIVQHSRKVNKHQITIHIGLKQLSS